MAIMIEISEYSLKALLKQFNGTLSYNIVISLCFMAYQLLWVIYYKILFIYKYIYIYGRFCKSDKMS